MQLLPLISRSAVNVEFIGARRPIQDVWESRRYGSLIVPNSKQELTFYGPDVGMSRSGNFDSNHGKKNEVETSLSYLIGTDMIDRLPLQGRDVFTEVVLLPGSARRSPELPARSVH